MKLSFHTAGKKWFVFVGAHSRFLLTCPRLPDTPNKCAMNQIWNSDEIIEHTARMARSLKRWTGRDLLAGNWEPRELAQRAFEASFVLVSHGTQADPILNYGNRTALNLWEMNWEDLIQTPSRLTAEAPNRAERARLLRQVTDHGYVDNYTGIRISKNGRRFRILQATVWNLLSSDDAPCGQAAMFDRWEFLKE